MIKKFKSELKAVDSELNEVVEGEDLRNLKGDFLIKKMEESIKLRETPVLKRLVKE